ARAGVARVGPLARGYAGGAGAPARGGPHRARAGLARPGRGQPPRWAEHWATWRTSAGGVSRRRSLLRQAYAMGPTWFDGDIERVVVTEEEIHDKIQELAARVATDYAGFDSVLLVGVLKGAYVFMADFARALGRQSRPVEVEFMAVSSYGQRTTSSGVV